MAFLLGASVGVGAAAASAATSESQVSCFTYSGHQYCDKAIVTTGTGTAQAFSGVGPSSSSGYTVPIGYVSSNGRLFSDIDGQLKCETNFQANYYTVSPGTYWFGHGCVKNSTGLWYSWGVVKAYDGYNWVAYYTLKSGDQNS